MKQIYKNFTEKNFSARVALEFCGRGVDCLIRLDFCANNTRCFKEIISYLRSHTTTGFSFNKNTYEVHFSALSHAYDRLYAQVAIALAPAGIEAEDILLWLKNTLAHQNQQRFFLPQKERFDDNVQKNFLKSKL